MQSPCGHAGMAYSCDGPATSSDCHHRVHGEGAPQYATPTHYNNNNINNSRVAALCSPYMNITNNNNNNHSAAGSLCLKESEERFYEQLYARCANSRTYCGSEYDDADYHVDTVNGSGAARDMEDGEDYTRPVMMSGFDYPHSCSTPLHTPRGGRQGCAGVPPLPHYHDACDPHLQGTGRYHYRTSSSAHGRYPEVECCSSTMGSSTFATPSRAACPAAAAAYSSDDSDCYYYNVLGGDGSMMEEAMACANALAAEKPLTTPKAQGGVQADSAAAEQDALAWMLLLLDYRDRENDPRHRMEGPHRQQHFSPAEDDEEDADSLDGAGEGFDHNNHLMFFTAAAASAVQADSATAPTAVEDATEESEQQQSAAMHGHIKAYYSGLFNVISGDATTIDSINNNLHTDYAGVLRRVVVSRERQCAAQQRRTVQSALAAYHPLTNRL